MQGSTRYHLDSEGWDTVVEMINWCLNDIQGADVDSDEEAKQLNDFEVRIRLLANRMGLKDIKRHGVFVLESFEQILG